MSENLQDLVNQSNEEENISTTSEIQNNMNQEINLGDKEFSKFISVMTTLSKVCTDLSVNKGIIRQSEDRRASFYLVDITDLVGQSDIYICGISSKVDLLDPFRKQHVNMKLSINETGYVFSDKYSKVCLTKPLINHLSNKYITEGDLNNTLKMDDQGEIFEYKLSKFLLDRLSAFTKSLAATQLLLDMKNNKTDLKIISGDDSVMTTAHLVTIDNSRPLTGIYRISVKPFMLGFDDITIKGYSRKTNDHLIVKSEAVQNNIKFTMYSLVEHLVEE